MWVFIAVALVTVASLLVTIWALYDDMVDLKITRQARSRLAQIALLRIGRDAAACSSEIILLVLSLAVIFHLDRSLLLGLLFMSFFDYPVFILGLGIYDRLLRRRRNSR
jgi:hypothetical protein